MTNYNPTSIDPASGRTAIIKALRITLWVLAALTLAAGAFTAIQSWPGEPRDGFSWKLIAYVPAVTALMTGLVSGAVLSTLAEGLHCLVQIRTRLAQPCDKMVK